MSMQKYYIGDHATYIFWWRHQMETFSVLLAPCAGKSPATGEFPHTKASDAKLWYLLLICAWINGWVNNRDAGDLSRHRAHYHVTVMLGSHWLICHLWTVACPKEKCSWGSINPSRSLRKICIWHSFYEKKIPMPTIENTCDQINEAKAIVPSIVFFWIANSHMFCRDFKVTAVNLKWALVLLYTVGRTFV